jgi:equilibrative nucleoside transporter 1/2/3
VLIAIPVLGFCHVYGIIGFNLTIIMVIMTALCTALCQGGIFGFAGMLPPIYIQAVMSGNGLAGITTSIIRVITKLTLESKKPITLETLNLSAAIYFFVSAGVIIMCILSYFVMVRTRFVAHFLGTGAVWEEEKASLLSEEEDLSIGYKASPLPPVSTLQVLKKIWHMCFLVCFIFFVSLAIFPGISVTIESCYGPKSAMADWLPVLMIVVFNVFDFIGRTLPRFVIMFGEKSIAIPIMLRVVLLPLFIFCIYPRLIVYDVIPLIFMAILALSNGYLSSITMMIAPGLVESHEREAAGTIMTFFLLLGICLGSNCGLLIGKIVGLN